MSDIPEHAVAAQANPATSALVHQALAHFEDGLLEEAIVACEGALKASQDSAEALLVLGLVSLDLDEPSHALPLLQRAHELRPDICEFSQALATVYARIGNINDGLFHAKVATTLPAHPDYPDLLPARFSNFLQNLEEAKPHVYRARAERLLSEGRAEEAVVACEKQLGIDPGDPATLRLLARATRAAGQVERAIAAGHALMHDANRCPADLSELAAALTDAGRHAEARTCHDTACTRAPNDPVVGSNRLSDLMRSPGIREVDLAAAHKAWWTRHGKPRSTRKRPSHPDSRPDRRLRIGYLCGSFHDSDLMSLCTPVLASHDREAFEVYCYSDSARSDLSTERLIRASDHWTDLNKVDEETAAEILRGDAIDIAVDLSGHGIGNRLPTLARKPAPITVSWLGYPHPTGLDHFLATPVTWPDRGKGRTVHYLDGVLAPFAPPSVMPAVNESPAAAQGHITFGIQGDLAAIDTAAAALCGTVLEAIPGARLIVANARKLDEVCIARTYDTFAHLGLRHRVDIVNSAGNFSNAFEFYQFVDIAFAIAGSYAETCRALWMGVPALGHTGNIQDRMSAAPLAAANRDAWICSDPPALAKVATSFAHDPSKLRDMRARQRNEISVTSLASVSHAVNAIESAYRELWRSR